MNWRVRLGRMESRATTSKNETRTIVPMKSPKIILQVEDDVNDVLLLRHALHKAGLPWQLQVVSDGQQAIHYLQGLGGYADRTK